MTLEEKIAHLQETVMTEARSEGNAIIDNHKKALESLFEKHKKEATAQSEVRIKSETLRARSCGKSRNRTETCSWQNTK